VATIAELVTKFVADTKSFDKGVKKVSKGTNAFGKGVVGADTKSKGLNKTLLASAKSYLGLAAAIGAAVKIGKEAIKIFAEFEQTMANVKAVTKATPEEFFRLKQAAKQAGETTRFSATQAADALYFLASAGLTAAESSEALEGVLLLAGATASDLGSTASTVTAVLSQYSLESTEAARVANVFAAATANSQATIEKLTGAFLQVGPVAAGLGISLEETTGALELLFNAGFRGETAGRALKSALADLSNESGGASKKLQALGISFNDVNPEAVGLSQAIRVLQEAGLGTTETLDIFGKVAGPQMAVLIKQGGDAIDEYTEAVTGTNEAAEQYAIQNDTLAGDLDILKSVTQSVAIEFGEGFAPVIRDTIQALIGLINFLKPLIEILAILGGVGIRILLSGFNAFGVAIGWVGNQFSKLLDIIEEFTISINRSIQENAFLQSALDKVKGAVGNLRREEEKSLETGEEASTQLAARAVAIKQFIEIMKEELRLKQELADIEKERIEVIIEAREKAKIAFEESNREIKAQLDLGVISQEEYSDKVIAANRALIDSIIDIGIEGNYANLIDDPVIEAAVAAINKLTAANELVSAELENQEAIEESLRLTQEARSQAALDAALKEKQALEDTTRSAENLKQTYIDIATSIPGQLASMFNAISTLREANTDAAVQALEAEGAARIAAGEDEVLVREDIEKKKAEIEYRGALAGWKLQLASSIASGAQMIIHGFLTQPFIPAGLIAGALATTLAAIQIGAVSKAKPQKQFATGTAGFTVPEGFPDDKFNIGLTSGERFSVDTPNQQGIGNDNLKQTIIVQLNDGVIFRTVNRGIQDRKVIVA